MTSEGTGRPIDVADGGGALEEEVRGGRPQRTGPPVRRAPTGPRESGGAALEPGADASAARILKRVLVFLLLVLGVYFFVIRGWNLFFAPRVETVRLLSPPELAQPGEAITFAVVVRNTGWTSGAAFVVAAFANGAEVEGPTIPVAARDSAVVPVQLALGSGEHSVSFVVFDGWRGVRRLDAFPGIDVQVERQVIPSDGVEIPDRAIRGESIPVKLRWSNQGQVRQTIVPLLVLRPELEGTPLSEEGPAMDVGPGETTTLEFQVDTWRLQPGRYLAEVHVRSAEGGPAGRGAELFPLVIAEAEPPR